VTQDDLLYRFRPRVFAMAAELGNVWAACRAIRIHPSIDLTLTLGDVPAWPRHAVRATFRDVVDRLAHRS
jgi:hypothetical protein